MRFALRGSLVLGALLLSGIARAGDGAPPTVEELVRDWVAGTPVDVLVARVREAPGEIVVSDAVLRELELAGAPPELVAALRERARSSTMTPPAALDATPASPVRLRVAGKGARRPLRIAVDPRPPLPVLLELGLDTDGPSRIEELALFVSCTTARHVPDQWRDATPLGRDFRSVVRHRILAFHPAGASEGPRPELRPPAELEVAVEPGEVHDIEVGLAARFGEVWVRLTGATLVGVEGGTPLVVTFREDGTRPGGWGVLLAHDAATPVP